MTEATTTQAAAERAVALMRAQGFDHAQATATLTFRDELNLQNNAPSLLRSTETRKLALLGIVDGRRASTELAAFDDEAALAERIAGLHADAASAPRDDANAVSSGQHARIVQGPQQGDVDALAATVEELLAYRAREAPKMMLQEGLAAHVRLDAQTCTSEGSDLSCRLGWYEASLFGTARDGRQSSSFNGAGGATHDLRQRPIAESFGIGEMMRDTERQIHARPVRAPFTGDVLLLPNAVSDLLGWLLGQLGDTQLIAGTSLYRTRVGEPVASPLLSLSSRFDGPGVAAVSADGFAAPPVDVLRDGTLLTLLPTLYGSRKTGLKHVPVAASGWSLAAGATPRAELMAGIGHGACVGRLSMGSPASNGDFSGVIKNSFEIENGAISGALSETMISGNVGRMLRDVIGVSRERIDSGGQVLPSLLIGGLHFS